MPYRSFLLIAFVVLLVSCNNNTDAPADNPNSNAKATMTAEEKTLREAIKNYPDSVLLVENLIQYFRENNNYSLALGETNKALQKDSLSDRLWDIKGILYFENGDTMQAIKAFENAITIRPEPEYVLSLGSLYAQTKNPLALEMADGLLHATKANAAKEAYFMKGLYYSTLGDNVKAISFFDQSLKEDYTYLFAYREKSICLYNLGKYNDALTELTKAIAVDKTFDEAYYWRGRCLEKLNRKPEAITSYQQALQIDPDYTEAGDALKALGVTAQ